MKKLLFVVFTVLLFSSSNAFSQKVWFISNPEHCNYWNYISDFYQDLQTTKYGDSLRFVKNFSEIKNVNAGDFYIYYQCMATEDKDFSGGILLSVCEIFGRLEFTRAGNVATSMHISDIYTFTQEAKDKNIRKSKLMILDWLNKNYNK